MKSRKPAKPVSKEKRPVKQGKTGRKDFSQTALSAVEKAIGEKL